MNTLRNILIGAVAVSALATQASAAPSATADIKANIIAPVSIAAGTSDLDFGTVVATAAGGTVIVTPAGARDNSGTATVIATTNVSAASFTITGVEDTAFGVTFAATNLTNSLTVGNFTATGCGYAGATGTTGSASIDSGTTCGLSVGATLTVPANATAGLLAGTLTTTVVYQ